MTGIYMVSAQKPTAVTHSMLGRVSSTSDLNLIICKSSLIEIYKVTAEGLKFLTQVSLWGVVENMCTTRLPHDTKDAILITTTKYDIMVLACELDASSGTIELKTKARGGFKDTIPRGSCTSMLTVVDPEHQLIAIKCYDGILKLLDTRETKSELKLETLRMNDLNVIDITFVQGLSQAALAVVSKEPTNKLILKIYEVETNAKELGNIMVKKDIHDNQAFLIAVPKPYAGVIVVGSQAIMYVNGKSNDGGNNSSSSGGSNVHKSPSFLSKGEITNYAMIDTNGQRFLLSNTIGQLYLMVLIADESSFVPRIVDLRFEYLGETSIAHTITYIDNGHVFVGSKLGDSQLIKLTDQPNEAGSFVTVLETYTNLGPILDMLVVDIQKQGQGQLITCSGASKNGSLRIIRSGIGIQEMANIELPGVKSIWPLRINTLKDGVDDHLVLSYFNYSKIFSFLGEEFDDIELDGFDLNSQTITCVNAHHSQVVQVTVHSVRLIKIKENADNNNSCALSDEWQAPSGEMFSVAVANSHECLVACRNKLNYLRFGKGALEFVKSIEFAHEIACLDIYSSGSCEEKREAELCAVGLWNDISAILLSMPNLEKICHEPLRGEIIPRSILIENLEGVLYLFVSLGDGSVISYIINRNIGGSGSDLSGSILSERRVVVLGTQPTILKKFSSTPTSNPTTGSSSSSSSSSASSSLIQRNVFACSDRPSVISSGNQKLVYSSVNLKQVEYMCELNAAGPYANCLALLSAGVLRIGKMDSIQKLHIRNVPLNESVRRIAYQAETQTFGILCIRMDTVNSNGDVKPMMPSASTQCSNVFLSKLGGGGLSSVHLDQNGVFVPHHLSKLTPEIGSATATSPAATTAAATSSAAINSNQQFSNGQFDTVSTHSFLIFDQNTFEVLQSIQFAPNEYALSILSMAFDSDPSTAYYIIGTAQVIEDEPEPKQGRLIVFKYAENNKMLQVSEREVKGAPYCMAAYNGKLLVGINNSLKLYEFATSDNQLVLLGSHADNVFIVHLKCKNDFILIGDMMKSCAVLTYRPETSSFECVARDHSPAWLNSIEIIDDDHFLMCDGFQNMTCLRKDSGQSNEDERKSLQTHGLIHIGEHINIFRHGSLGMHQQSNESLGEHVTGSILSGSVSGSILLFSQLSEIMFKILNELQNRIAHVLQPAVAGKIEYKNWRKFETERRMENCKHFIDGDLIESYLELSSTDAALVAKDFKIDGSNLGHNGEEFSVSYFNKLVEELSRLH